MAFKGTAVTRGTGEGIVVATGMETELGHISSLTAEAKEEITPLEKKTRSPGKKTNLDYDRHRDFISSDGNH